MSTEKPFPPSVKRLKKLQSEGNIVRSRTVTHFLSWIITGVVLNVILSLEFLRELIQCVENGSGAAGIQASIGLGVRSSVYAIALTVGVPGLINVFAELFQARWSVATKALRFAPERLSAGSGFKKLGRAFRSFPGALARFSTAVCSIGFLIYGIAGDLPELVNRDGRLVLRAVSAWSLEIWGTFAACLCVASGVEYLLAKRRYLRDNGMSYEELRQEQKDEEGDPHIRAERRSMHEWLAKGDLRERVRRSKVILIGRKNRSGNGKNGN